MANMFGKYTADCEARQKKIEKTDVADTTADEMDEKRTTLSLLLTVSEKKTLQMMVLKRETTITAIIYEWVQERLEEGEK